MADYKTAIAAEIKDEGGYQNDPDDKGNILNNVNYGTKYGITPGAWLAYYNKPLQPDTIKALTIDQATPIYKKNYWDKIRGDEIENDSLASLMFFTVINSGLGHTKTFRKVINAIAGKRVTQLTSAGVETTGALTAGEIKILNSLDAKRVFGLLKATREKFYRDLAAADPVKQKYLNGWLARLNRHQFIEKKKPVTQWAALVLLLILAAWWFFLRR